MDFIEDIRTRYLVLPLGKNDMPQLPQVNFSILSQGLSPKPMISKQDISRFTKTPEFRSEKHLGSQWSQK